MAADKAEGFEGLGLRGELLAALSELGYEEPTPVQRAALPPLLEGRDVLGQAATGTGKTAAFALPLLQRLEPGKCKPFETSALIVVPTRELAMQVAEAVHSYGRGMGVSVLPVYGGQDFSVQLRRLKRGVDVVVATPGRALDHLRRKTLKLDQVTTVVLDEADEMLDLGFAEDLDTLLGEVPDTAQTALFSATLPPRIAAIAERHLKNPARVKIAATESKAGSLPKIRQMAYVVPRQHKDLALGRLLDVESPQSAIIFCRTRNDVERLADVLSGHGYEAEAIHGGLTQEQRDRVLRGFKAGELQVLVATDVAARGLDVEKLSHVFNFDLPTSPEPYVHRIGRTGRAGREGSAITLLEPRELRLLQNIERATGQKIEIGQLPTVVDLRAKRIDLTRAAVEDALADAEGLEDYRRVVEQLSETVELADVAAAAIRALHERLNPQREEDELEIPRFDPKQQRERTARPRPEGRAGPRIDAGPRAPRPSSPDRGGTDRRAERPQSHAPMSRLFVGAGRSAGIRPADLVGAIANEAHLTVAEIGTIQVADHHSMVEVAEDRVEDVINALRQTTLRGRRVRVDLFKRK